VIIEEEDPSAIQFTTQASNRSADMKDLPRTRKTRNRLHEQETSDTLSRPLPQKLLKTRNAKIDYSVRQLAKSGTLVAAK
jgi:hypothetical protein